MSQRPELNSQVIVKDSRINGYRIVRVLPDGKGGDYLAEEDGHRYTRQHCYYEGWMYVPAFSTDARATDGTYCGVVDLMPLADGCDYVWCDLKGYGGVRIPRSSFGHLVITKGMPVVVEITKDRPKLIQCSKKS